MISTSYPEGITLKREDVVDCNLAQVLSDVEGDYHSIHSACSAAAKQAIEDGREAAGKALWLLADACSMYMKPESRNEPFGPMMSFGDRRTAIVSDFSEEDIDWFASSLDDLENSLLRARIADIVWLLKKSHGIAVPRCAIDAYCQIPIGTDQEWIKCGGDCWKRALTLAASIGDGAEGRVADMEANLLTKFDQASEANGYLLLWLADLMQQFGLGESRSNDIAARLGTVAMHFASHMDFHRSRDYYQGSADWYRKVSNDELAVDQTVAIAEAYAQEAELRASGENPSNMVAASFLENAIQAYRTVPRQHRTSRRVDERIAELHARMSKAGAAALDEMSTIQSEEIDLSEMVQHAKKIVRDKSIKDALLGLANVSPFMNSKTMRESAKESLEQASFRHLFSSTHFSSDGRCIAKTPGADFREGSQDVHESLIRKEMLQHHRIQMSLRVQGYVLPAWREMQIAHRLTIYDFVHIANHSPIVPPNRSYLWGKALYFGYDGDWGTALHLLSPQIEHMVRYHIKAAGAKTTNLDQQGIENENGMSTLMELPQVEKVFGADISFELWALFCDPVGPNLRNELAHGLLDDSIGRSLEAVYVWWLALKLVFNTFWNALTQSKIPEKERDNQ